MKNLKIAAVSLTIALAISGAGWYVYDSISKLERRAQAAENRLNLSENELSKLKSEAQRITTRLDDVTATSANLRAELVRLQRINFDHDKMLSTIFKIERSGDSTVGIQRKPGQAISISVTR